MYGDPNPNRSIRIGIGKEFLQLNGRSYCGCGRGEGGHHGVANGFHNGSLQFANYLINFYEMVSYFREGARVPFIIIEFSGTYYICE